MKLLSCTGALALLFATPAAAQIDLAQQKDWGAMYGRIDAIVRPYESRLGLPRYWDTYCLTKVNADEDAHPKDGSIPLGVTDWRALDHDAFRTDLGILEQYKTGAMMLCLANVKATLNAADRK